jgi:hypothetical protein
MNKPIKLKIIGENELFPWRLGDEIFAQEITHLEDRLHRIVIDDTLYIMELGKWGINGRNIFVKGFITDNKTTGTIAFEIVYE